LFDVVPAGGWEGETTKRKKIDPGANMAAKYFLHSLKKVIKVTNGNHLPEQPPRKVGERDLSLKGGFMEGLGFAYIFFMFLFFLILVALSRWIFRINHIVTRLDNILNALTVGFNLEETKKK
jgi:hypothetical protein